MSAPKKKFLRFRTAHLEPERWNGSWKNCGKQTSAW